MLKVLKRSVAKSTGIDCCHRCGGLMVSEPVHELASYDWRCVSCGERIDPVILAHRRQGVVHSKDEKIVVNRGQLALS